MRRALIDKDGNVVNVIEVAEGSGYRTPKGLALVDADGGAEPGGTYDGEAFVRKVRPAVPDVAGLRGALLEEMGIEKANDLAKGYPVFDGALLAGRFDAARQILALAESRGDLLAEDAATVRAAMTAHNIPE